MGLQPAHRRSGDQHRSGRRGGCGVLGRNHRRARGAWRRRKSYQPQSCAQHLRVRHRCQPPIVVGRPNSVAWHCWPRSIGPRPRIGVSTRNAAHTATVWCAVHSVGRRLRNRCCECRNRGALRHDRAPGRSVGNLNRGSGAGHHRHDILGSCGNSASSVGLAITDRGIGEALWGNSGRHVLCGRRQFSNSVPWKEHRDYHKGGERARDHCDPHDHGNLRVNLQR